MLLWIQVEAAREAKLAGPHSFTLQLLLMVVGKLSAEVRALVYDVLARSMTCVYTVLAVPCPCYDFHL